MSSNSSIYINGVLQDPKQSRYTGQGIMTSYTLNPHSIQPIQSLSNVSLGAINGGTSSWFNELSVETSYSPQVKKYEVYETPEDILALSCTLQRLRKTQPGVKFRILDTTVIASVTPDDKTKAQAMRDYYSKKIMMGKLTDKFVMTKYREDMNQFIHGEVTRIKSTDIGMACFLPTFYDEDVELDTVKCQVTVDQGFVAMDKKYTPKSMQTTVALTPLKKITRRTRNKVIFQYWFKDDSVNGGVMLELPKDNPLLHIWDFMFENESTIKIFGNFARRTLDEFEHYSITKWELSRT